LHGLDPHRLASLDEDVRAELATVFPSLAGLATGRRTAIQHERYRSHRAVCTLLETLAQAQPVLLVLDDVHWADPASVELLEVFAERERTGHRDKRDRVDTDVASQPRPENRPRQRHEQHRGRRRPEPIRGPMEIERSERHPTQNRDESSGGNDAHRVLPDPSDQRGHASIVPGPSIRSSALTRSRRAGCRGTRLPRARDDRSDQEVQLRVRRSRMVARRGLLVLALALAAAGLVAAAIASAAEPRSRIVSIYAPQGTSQSCARVLPLRRTVASPAVLTGAMRALLAGPTAAERARGYGGWFSRKTAGHLRSVRIAGGVAYVDFRSFAREIPGASSSCGSALLLAQLGRTANQFPTVSHAVYSFDGSRRAFYEWLQRDVAPRRP
jgi:AAA ATPase domain/Sporulation and spore germination